jgi:hypothetical protein
METGLEPSSMTDLAAGPGKTRDPDRVCNGWMEPTGLARLWSAFPIRDRPRPVVLLEHPAKVSSQGFVDDRAKVAWGSGAIRAAVPVPADVLARLGGDAAGSAAGALIITGAARTRASFLTDRGARELPAFELEISGLHEPCLVLDPEVPVWWPRADQWDSAEQLAGTAEVDGDDLTVHFSAGGSVLTEFVRAEFVEHETYVVGRPITFERPMPPGATAIPAALIVRTVTGKLTRPLGARVLVNEWGHPLLVTRTCREETLNCIG